LATLPKPTPGIDPGQHASSSPRVRKALDVAAKAAAAAWWSPVDQSFLDARATPLSPQGRHLLLILDVFAGRRCWAFPALATLAAMMGRQPRATQLTLGELEAGGWIRRIHGPQGELLGIVLRKRASATSPAASDDAALAEAEAAIRGRKNLRPGDGQGANGCALRAQEFAPLRAQILAPEERQFSELDPANNTQSIPDGSGLDDFEGKEGTEDCPETEAVPVTQRAIREKAKALHAAVYQGIGPHRTDASWKEHQGAWIISAKAIVYGHVRPEQVEKAIREARKPESRIRGAVFNGAIRQAAEDNGHGPGDRSGPAPGSEHERDLAAEKRRQAPEKPRRRSGGGGVFEMGAVVSGVFGAAPVPIEAPRPKDDPARVRELADRANAIRAAREAEFNEALGAVRRLNSEARKRWFALPAEEQERWIERLKAEAKGTPDESRLAKAAEFGLDMAACNRVYLPATFPGWAAASARLDAASAAMKAPITYDTATPIGESKDPCVK
jgi:hypothetical protein